MLGAYNQRVLAFLAVTDLEWAIIITRFPDFVALIGFPTLNGNALAAVTARVIAFEAGYANVVLTAAGV